MTAGNKIAGRTRRGVLRVVLGTGGVLGGIGAAACGVAGRGSDAPAVKDASRGPADITYATTWTGDSLEVLKQGLAAVKQKAPHITVNIAPQPSRDQTIATFAAGAGPDALRLTGQIGPRLYEGGQILELSERLKAAKINLDKDYTSSKLERWAGKTYAMPHTVSPHAWYYNKSLFKRVGAKDPWDDLKGNWTWADLLDAAKRVTTATGAADEVWGIEFDYANAWGQHGQFVWTNGGEFIDTSPDPRDWRKWKYTFSNPRTVEGLQFAYDLLTTHRVMIPKDRASELTKAGFANLFASQKTAMFEQSSGQLITQIQARNSFEWDVAPIPRAKAGGKAGVPLWSGNPTGVNKDSKFLDASWELALQMALDDVQNIFSRARTVTAALIRSLTIPGGFESPPPDHVSVFRSVGIEGSGTWNYHPAFDELETVARNELTDAFSGKKALRQACADIDAQAAAVMARGV
jgi:ABC-type glycerol-3-phosphate transport system substrate-binding protein